MPRAPTRLTRTVLRDHLDDAAPLPAPLFLELTPDAWNDPERPRYDLRVIPAALDVRQEHFKLTMPSQPITAYEGDVKRFVSIDRTRSSKSILSAPLGLC
jgi:hypothetical protein